MLPQWSVFAACSLSNDRTKQGSRSLVRCWLWGSFQHWDEAALTTALSQKAARLWGSSRNTVCLMQGREKVSLTTITLQWGQFAQRTSRLLETQIHELLWKNTVVRAKRRRFFIWVSLDFNNSCLCMNEVLTDEPYMNNLRDDFNMLLTLWLTEPWVESTILLTY